MASFYTPMWLWTIYVICSNTWWSSLRRDLKIWWLSLVWIYAGKLFQYFLPLTTGSFSANFVLVLLCLWFILVFDCMVRLGICGSISVTKERGPCPFVYLYTSLHTHMHLCTTNHSTDNSWCNDVAEYHLLTGATALKAEFCYTCSLRLFVRLIP